MNKLLLLAIISSFVGIANADSSCSKLMKGLLKKKTSTTLILSKRRLVSLIAFGTLGGIGVTAAHCIKQSLNSNLDQINEFPDHQDKAKHCSLSCLVSLDCKSVPTIVLGAAKEAYDFSRISELLGGERGNAEMKDLEADFIGVELSREVKNPNQCIEYCFDLLKMPDSKSK